MTLTSHYIVMSHIKTGGAVGKWALSDTFFNLMTPVLIKYSCDNKYSYFPHSKLNLSKITENFHFIKL